MFSPIRTERLLVRPFRAGDAVGLVRPRNDPKVARYQDWVVPYSTAQGEEMVAHLAAMEGPESDEWWMAIVCDPETDEVFGDLALHLTSGSRTAEVGYTFASEHWGKGYATESLAALIEYLFKTFDVTRVFGMLHPDNPASAMVLERCGFLFEGHTRSSFWLGDECSDDWIYGITRPDWETWRDRPRHAPVAVSLIEVTVDNQRAVSNLRTDRTQQAFVAPTMASFADALFPEVHAGAPVVPWMRGVEADGALVGFVMLALATISHPEPYLWRLLIDRLHQRRGIGGRVLDLIRDECRAIGNTTLLTSWVEGKGSPALFYRRYGFDPTGRVIDGETEARLTFP